MKRLKRLIPSGKKLSAFAASAGVLGSLAATNAADAAIVVPSGLNPGDKFNLVFVSNSTTTALSNNPAVYDAIVQADAVAAGIATFNGDPVQWFTLGSFEGGPTAIGRFNPGTPIYRLDSGVVATDGTDLWDLGSGGDNLLSPISIAADLNELNVSVWTGTQEDGHIGSIGEIGDTSFGLTNGTKAGLSNATDATWINSDFLVNSSEFHLYAFSEELTVPGAVPQPTSGLVWAGVVPWLLSLFRRNR